MGNRLTKKLRGFGALDPGYVAAALDMSETTATEAGPRPGTSESSSPSARLVPQVVGAQTKPVTLVGTNSAGFPGLGEKGAGVGYYLHDDGETAADTRHWRAPWLVTDARGFGSSIRATFADAVAFPRSGKILVYFPRYTGGGDATYTYDPLDGSWTTNPAAPTDSGVLAVVPGTERVLLVSGQDGVTWYSDDYGATWNVQARFRAWPYWFVGTGGYTSRQSAAFDGAGNLQVAAYASGTSGGGADGWYFFASSDLGCTWSPLVIPSGAIPQYAALVISSHPSGSIACAFVDFLSADLYLVMIGSAYDLPGSGSPLLVEPGTFSYCSVSVDDDGIVYVWGYESNEWRAWYSLDVGGSIEDNTYGSEPRILSAGSAGTEFPTGVRVVHSAGRALLAHGGNATGNVYRGAVFLGGWAGPTFDRIFDGEYKISTRGRARELLSRLHGSGGPQWWGAIDDPAGLTTPGWVSSGTGTFTHGAFGIQIADFDARSWSYVYSSAGDNDDAYGYFSARVDDEGDGSRVFYEVLAASTGLRIYLDDAAWRVYDVDAAAVVGADVPYTANARLHFEVFVEDASGEVTILWREAGAGTKWSTVTRTLAATGSRATTAFAWGALASVAATDATWFYVGGISEFQTDGAETAPALISGSAGWGKAIGGEYPYPLPDTSDVPNRVLSRLALRGGPVVLGELYVHDVAPDYPVEAALFPDLSPSPDTVWRSTADGVTTDFVVDFKADGLVADSWTWLVLVRNANFRRLQVASKPDGGAYGPAATLDLATGFASGLTYTLQGRHVRPTDTYVATAGARYVAPGELVGGHAILDADGSGGGPFYRRIVSNTGGFWGAGTPRLSITLADVDGTEDASGDIVIVWPSGYMPIHLDRASGSLTRRVRFRIPSTEETAEGYLEAGTIAIFGFRPLGKQWGNGYEIIMSSNVASRVDAYGTDRRRQLGPNAREAIVSWDHGVDLSRLRGVSDADYLGAPTKAELVARDEVWRQVWDLYDRSEGGARPVLLVHDVPASGVTITDPDAFLLGYLDGSARATHVRGDDIVDEFVRFGAIRIREAV